LSVVTNKMKDEIEHIARVGEKRNAYTIMIRQPEWKRSLGRHKRKWENNIRVNHYEPGWEVANWIHVAHDTDQWLALVKIVVCIRLHKKQGFPWLAEWVLASQEGLWN